MLVYLLYPAGPFTQVVKIRKQAFYRFTKENPIKSDLTLSLPSKVGLFKGRVGGQLDSIEKLALHFGGKGFDTVNGPDLRERGDRRDRCNGSFASYYGCRGYHESGVGPVVAVGTAVTVGAVVAVGAGGAVTPWTAR